MVHVYGVGGRVFGGAENIPVVPVQRIVRLDTVQSFMADERPAQEPGAVASGALVPPRGGRAGEAAMAAYGQAAAPPMPPPARIPRLVAQVMTAVVVTVRADATLAEAAAWMARHRVGQAPVLDEDGQLVGLLGRAQVMAGPADMQRPVREAMVSPVAAPLPDTDVHRVARLMLEYGVAGFAVVDADGGLCGFVARGDLLRVLADEPALEAWA